MITRNLSIQLLLVANENENDNSHVLMQKEDLWLSKYKSFPTSVHYVNRIANKIR